MPRLLLIEPGQGESGAFQPDAGEGMRLALDPDTEIVARATRMPVASAGSAPEALLLDLEVYEAGLGAEEEGFDAVYVQHALDPGVAALRSVLSIPVLGAGRAAMLYALTLGTRFGILAPDAGTAVRLRKAVHDSGLDPVCTSVHIIDGAIASEHACLAAARRCVEADAAEVVVLGSTGMARIAGTLSRELGAPVVEPGRLGLILLESLLALGLSHSRRAHPEPLVRKDALVRALVVSGAAGGSGSDA